MKIREGFVLREIADSIVVVPTGDLLSQFKGIINLNHTGKFMWELLQNDVSMEEIVDRLIEEYGISLEKAMKIANNFTEQLKNANFIEE